MVTDASSGREVGGGLTFIEDPASFDVLGIFKVTLSLANSDLRSFTHAIGAERCSEYPSAFSWVDT